MKENTMYKLRDTGTMAAYSKIKLYCPSFTL